MPSPAADPKINGQYRPRHFVSDGNYGFYVEGFTSDTMRDWTLKVAPLLSNGQPDMQNVSPFFEVVASWPVLDEFYGERSISQINTLTLLVGNTQRLCQGMPTL